MRSLQQQVLALVIGIILLLSIGYMVTMGVWLQDRAELAAITKAKSDLATFEEIINLKYPGEWRVENGILYKGATRVNNNFEMVDNMHRLTGDTCTIFLGNTRVCTTIRKESGERAIGTKVSEVVAKTVLKNGNLYVGDARVLTKIYQTAYKPIRDHNQKIIGMLYVGTPKKFYQEMFYGSLKRVAASGTVITVIMLLVAWFFTQRVIIQPLKEITHGSKDIATRGVFRKVNVQSNNEIGELGSAFNEMSSRMEELVSRFEKAAGLVNNGQKEEAGISAGSEEAADLYYQETPGSSLPSGLPKGLNEVTLNHILDYLKRNPGKSLSSDDVAEEVGFTRVTVRRYLDYLEKNKQLEVEYKYGSVGRPVKLYKWPAQS